MSKPHNDVTCDECGMVAGNHWKGCSRYDDEQAELLWTFDYAVRQVGPLQETGVYIVLMAVEACVRDFWQWITETADGRHEVDYAERTRPQGGLA